MPVLAIIPVDKFGFVEELIAERLLYRLSVGMRHREAPLRQTFEIRVVRLADDPAEDHATRSTGVPYGELQGNLSPIAIT